MKLKTIEPSIRLKNKMKINPINGCWEWNGAFKNGIASKYRYGSLMIGSHRDKTRKTISAHRYSYMVFVGDIPNGLFVCHKCDNPKCINPDHLFVGTRQDNVDDRQRKGRNVTYKGEKHPRAKLTNDIVANIKADMITGVERRVIAKKYKASISALKDIRHGRTWGFILPPPPANQTLTEK